MPPTAMRHQLPTGPQKSHGVSLRSGLLYLSNDTNAIAANTARTTPRTRRKKSTSRSDMGDSPTLERRLDEA